MKNIAASVNSRIPTNTDCWKLTAFDLDLFQCGLNVKEVKYPFFAFSQIE